LFPALENPEHPWHEPVLAFLGRWDQAVGEVLDRFAQLPEPKRLLVLADHGFTSLTMEVDLNAWLREQGLLILDGPARHELDGRVISARSQAFALDPGRICLHTSRFGRGRVPPEQAATLGERIRAGLLRLHWQGQPVLREVLSWREAYPELLRDASAVTGSGRTLQLTDPAAPDLICIPNPGFSLRAKFDRAATFGMAERQGCHTPGDAFFHDSAGSRPTRVRDVGAEVLQHFTARGSIITGR
jgi:predicted AlkP superfamily phosphohydrolase/phosphomutase